MNAQMMKDYMNKGMGADVLVNRNASAELDEMLAELADCASMLSARVCDKLSAYGINEFDEAKQSEPCRPIRSFPPYFSSLREKIFSIKNFLKGISTAIDNCEL